MIPTNEVSDDESTVVCNRRSTLKSAQSEQKSCNTFYNARKYFRSSNNHSEMGPVSHVTQEKVGSILECIKKFEKADNSLKSCSQGNLGGIIQTRKERICHKDYTNATATGSSDEVSESQCRHPLVVSVDNDFLLKDDTSGFYSASEQSQSSHPVVCLPSDRTPYYVKKLRENARNKMESTLLNEQPDNTLLTRQYEMDASISPAGCINKSQEIASAVVGVTSESTQKRACESKFPKHDVQFTSDRSKSEIVQFKSSKVSSSLSQRLAVFQKQSNSVGMKTMHKPAKKQSIRKSAERWSTSKRRRSRTSSISLKDVLESRQRIEEETKSSLGEITHLHVAGVETNENVRPSQLLKKLATTAPPSPPTPLTARRGFTSISKRSSSGRERTQKNLRCF